MVMNRQVQEILLMEYGITGRRKSVRDAWVQYTWNNEVTITGTDAYYFTDGNFAPASVSYQYLDADGNWKEVENGEGFGVKLNQYNKTTFAPVTTTAIRMWMKPKTLGCGVIEWKVYGYSNEMATDKQLLSDN